MFHLYPYLHPIVHLVPLVYATIFMSFASYYLLEHLNICAVFVCACAFALVLDIFSLSHRRRSRMIMVLAFRDNSDCSCVAINHSDTHTHTKCQNHFDRFFTPRALSFYREQIQLHFRVCPVLLELFISTKMFAVLLIANFSFLRIWPNCAPWQTTPIQSLQHGKFSVL